MNFTFEYNHGGIKLYSGQGEHKKEVPLEELGWNTSPQFTYIAKEMYLAFNSSMGRLAKEKGHKNLVGKITLDLKIPLSKDN